ncbi:major facilitator superfamily permease [Bordetella avium]|nr:major facilitator superfamily permease [Bordetella avium]
MPASTSLRSRSARILLWAWWPLSQMKTSLLALVLGIIVLELGGQVLHVTNQSLIFRTRPEAHRRLVGLYVLFYAIDSGLGVLAGAASACRARRSAPRP